MNRKLVLVALTALLLLAIVLPVTACPPPPPPTEGCTPGYWKQPHHFDSWVKYTQDDLFVDVFGVSMKDKYGEEMTLLDALKQGGGGEKAFGRHIVAALLNANHPDVDYYDEAWVMRRAEEVLDSGRFEVVKNDLEAANEMGCPLN